MPPKPGPPSVTVCPLHEWNRVPVPVRLDHRHLVPPRKAAGEAALLAPVERPTRRERPRHGGVQLRQDPPDQVPAPGDGLRRRRLRERPLRLLPGQRADGFSHRGTRRCAPARPASGNTTEALALFDHIKSSRSNGPPVDPGRVRHPTTGIRVDFDRPAQLRQAISVFDPVLAEEAFALDQQWVEATRPRRLRRRQRRSGQPLLPAIASRSRPLPPRSTARSRAGRAWPRSSARASRGRRRTSTFAAGGEHGPGRPERRATVAWPTTWRSCSSVSTRERRSSSGLTTSTSSETAPPPPTRDRRSRPCGTWAAGSTSGGPTTSTRSASSWSGAAPRTTTGTSSRSAPRKTTASRSSSPRSTAPLAFVNMANVPSSDGDERGCTRRSAPGTAATAAIRLVPRDQFDALLVVEEVHPPNYI